VEPEKSQGRLLIYVAAGLFALVAAAHIGAALTGNSIIRAAPLGTALLYARGHIDLMRPVIVGFTATGTPSALEFPLWQAAAALAFKLTRSTWYGCANLTSLFCFASGLWPFYKVAQQYIGERAARWALVLFVCQPVNILMAGMTSADGLALASSLWFVYFADRLIRSGEFFWWLPATVFGALTAVLKLPFFMAAGLCSLGMLLINDIWKARTWLLLASSGLLSGIIFAAWTAHTNELAATAEFPYAELRISRSPWLAFWYFGDLRYRLSAGVWAKGLWRFTHATMGALPVLALFVMALLQRSNRLPKLWLAAVFFTTLVFTHLVLHHWHYYLMACPAVAMLCGGLVAGWQPWLQRQLHSLGLRVGLTLFAIALASIQGLVAMKIGLDLDPFPRHISGILQQHTSARDKLIVLGEATWGSEVLFRSGREGLSVIGIEGGPNAPAPKGLRDMLDNEADLHRLKVLGFTKLVLLSQSPVQYAASATRPGVQPSRTLYPSHISPKVDAWPVIFQSEDILVREIP
jgi:hypothetical protein